MSTEVIPDFIGLPIDEQRDPLLLRITATHYGPLNREQLSRRPHGAGRVPELIEGQPHSDKGQFGIYQVPDSAWNNSDTAVRDQLRKNILKQVWGDHTGYPEEFYATKDTFTEDAEFCYMAHGFPGDERHSYACIDYQDDSKRLTDPQWESRGAEMGTPRPHIFLCNFCRYESVVTIRKRSLRGDYDA